MLSLIIQCTYEQGIVGEKAKLAGSKATTATSPVVASRQTKGGHGSIAEAIDGNVNTATSILSKKGSSSEEVFFVCF